VTSERPSQGKRQKAKGRRQKQKAKGRRPRTSPGPKPPTGPRRSPRNTPPPARGSRPWCRRPVFATARRRRITSATSAGSCPPEIPASRARRTARSPRTRCRRRPVRPARNWMSGSVACTSARISIVSALRKCLGRGIGGAQRRQRNPPEHRGDGDGRARVPRLRKCGSTACMP
jgi:hypothetical protein